MHGTHALYLQAMTSRSQLPYDKGLAGWLRIYKLRIASNQMNVQKHSRHIRLAHQVSFPREVVLRERLCAAYPRCLMREGRTGIAVPVRQQDGQLVPVLGTRHHGYGTALHSTHNTLPT